ncbi:uncharacterized protein LOC110853191 [Folsomia candida]|uniref:uncharacterized protein LOC110853191 n=1 Tax=Folsomia candida TaxID=158441 RepID=UPI000B8FCDE8|nr:uncharacterized protein LOC110853191 [Folsomia candida]XP_035710520.1 uncharacterized protein LOC110853191 [Folsomia candida]
MLAQGRMIFLLTSAGVVSSQQVESPTVRQKNVQNTEYDDSATSVIVIMGFLAVILILSGIGIGCSYLCYRRSERKALSTTRALVLGSRSESSTTEAGPPHHHHLPPRVVPNWYGPAPDEARFFNPNNNSSPLERRHLLFASPPPPVPPRTPS